MINKNKNLRTNWQDITAGCIKPLLPAVLFKCRVCGWKGIQREMIWFYNGFDDALNCPKCNEVMYNNQKLYCDEIKNGR